MDEELDTSWQCGLSVQKENCNLCCIKSNVGSRLREGILPFYPARSQNKRDVELLERVQMRPQMWDGASLIWRQRELGLFTLKKRRLQEKFGPPTSA